MGSAGAELLVTLQILPGFFSNCLFMALYDSVVLLKRVVSLLSCSRSVSCGEWRRMLTSAGLRAIWNSFLLDAYKQVTISFFPPVAALLGDSENGGATVAQRDKRVLTVWTQAHTFSTAPISAESTSEPLLFVQIKLKVLAGAQKTKIEIA